MGCGSCSSGGCSSTGCGRNGGCATGGCNKLNTFDWLGNMLPPDKTEVDNIYEIRFKNTRKGFYRNVHGLLLYIGDKVVVESDRGYDVGTLSLGGITAELQMKKKKFNKPVEEIPRIFRKANENDLEMLEKVRGREAETRARAREIIEELKLDMKLSEVEFQGDNAKAIFYYIADHRVDFRELIKILAREFRIRVEMKQIGLRHEAGLVGGIGSCGRELCCSTWLTEFKTVSTSAARYQNLSLNPMKISGLCGRLKCCLNFELDAYLDALKDFPQIEKLETVKGKLILQKTDIFKSKMWFSYEGETSWYPLEIEEVKRIMALNKEGKKPEASLQEMQAERKKDIEKPLDFVDVVGQTSTKEERPSNKNRSKSKSNRKGNPRHKRQQGRTNRQNRQEKQQNKSGTTKKQSPKGSPKKTPNVVAQQPVKPAEKTEQKTENRQQPRRKNGKRNFNKRNFNRSASNNRRNNSSKNKGPKGKS